MALRRTRDGDGVGPEDGDPALADFPVEAPGTRRWCFADQLGPHFLDAPDQPVLLIESRAVLGSRVSHRLTSRRTWWVDR